MSKKFACFLSEHITIGGTALELLHETVKIDAYGRHYSLCACGANDESGYHPKRGESVKAELMNHSDLAYVMTVDI